MSTGRGITASIMVALSVSFIWAGFAWSIDGEEASGGPPAVAPGHAPLLPQLGVLAEPRSQDQVGFPAALTKSVIPREAR